MALDGVLSAHREFGGCVTVCCHCGIRFLTHPRNTGRQDLRCPFGCGRHHCRQRANQRSRKHYQTADGRRNKKRLNGKRSQHSSASPDGEAESPDSLSQPVDFDSPSAHTSRTKPVDEALSKEAAKELPGEVEPWLTGLRLHESSLLSSPVLAYVRMVASLIEGRIIGLAELVETLRKAMRQRSIALRTRIDYVLRFLHQHPP